MKTPESHCISQGSIRNTELCWGANLKNVIRRISYRGVRRAKKLTRVWESHLGNSTSRDLLLPIVLEPKSRADPPEELGAQGRAPAGRI